MGRRHAALDWRSWDQARRAALRRDRYRCRNCGRPGRLEVDHIQPLDKGGAAFDSANLQTLCRTCHRQKTARENPGDPERRAWRDYIKRLSQV